MLPTERNRKIMNEIEKKPKSDIMLRLFRYSRKANRIIPSALVVLTRK